MPALPPLPSYLTVDELERHYRAAADPVARSHFQIIWLLSGGCSTAEVAQVTSYSEDWVLQVAQRYRKSGPDGLGDRRHHNPGAPALLDAAGQAALRMALAGPVPSGGVWTGRLVAQWMSDYLGRSVSPQRGWEYMRRLGTNAGGPGRRASEPNVQANSDRRDILHFSEWRDHRPHDEELSDPLAPDRKPDLEVVSS